MNRGGATGSGSDLPVSGGAVAGGNGGAVNLMGIHRDIVSDLKEHFFPSFTDEAIVDVRMTVAKEGSVIEKQLNDLKYEKILPSSIASTASVAKPITTFNNGINMWVWRKKQGNFDGRLKPIIGIMLSPLATSTILVCQGYLRLEESIGSQYLWIKRAADIHEENALAIIDLKVTVGKVKDKASALYMSPGQGFAQVDGNFTPDTIIGTILSSNAPDTFLWCLIRSEENAGLHTASTHASIDGVLGERGAVTNAVNENAKKAILAAAKQSRTRKLVSVFSLSGSRSNFSMSAGRGTDSDSSCVHYGTLLNVTRSAVRNYVPWTLRFYSTVSTISFDFSELFHSFTNKMGEMSLTKFKIMLASVGLYFSGRESNTLFYLFNRSANASIKAVDFIAMLSYSGYEIDCMCETVKRRILSAVNYVESSSTSTNYLTIAQKQLVSSLFELVNSNSDGILAKEDFRHLATAMGIHLSEHELKLVIDFIFSLNKKNSEIMTIDVKDFLTFIETESNLLYHRANRIYHTQSKLRLWLKHMADKGSQSSVTYTKQVISQLYADLGKRNYLADVGAFDNVLLPQHMMMLLVGLDVNLYVDEVYLLCSILIPHKSILHITPDDLINFMTQPAHRSFGELIVIMEKKLLVQPFKQYSVHRSNSSVHIEASEGLFNKLFDEVKEHIKSKGGCVINKENEHLLIATSAQIKNGVENYANISISDTGLPTLGEWALLSLVSDCVVTANPMATTPSANDTSFGGNHLISGIAINQFLMGLLLYRHHKHHHSLLLENVVRKLVNMLRQQARASSSAKYTYNYKAVFDLFDGDLSGHIDVDEFRGMLVKYNLLGANIKENLHLINDLISLFDRRSNGYIAYDDFLKFIDSNRDLVGDLDSDEDDSDDEDTGNGNIGFVPTDPPMKITANHESDCLLWHIWKEAMKVDAIDPEGVVNNLLDACNNVSDPVSIRYNIDIKSNGKGNGSIAAGSLWSAIEAAKLRGTIGIVQYDTGVQYFKHDAVLDSKVQYHRLYYDSSRVGMADPVDYVGFCRSIVKMGLSYTAKDNNKRILDESRYYNLWHALVKELCSLKFSTDVYDDQLYRIDSPKDPLTSTISSELSATSSSVASFHINSNLKSLPRFAKAFYRLDHDGDGCITEKEFKKALRKLKIYSIRDWPAQYVHRLFEEFAATASSGSEKGKKGSVLNIDAFVSELLSSKEYNDVHKEPSLHTASKNVLGRSITAPFRGTSSLDTYFDEDFRPVDYDSGSDIFEKIRKVLGASIVYPNPVDTFGSSLQRRLGNTDGLDIPMLKNAFDTHTETIVESVHSYFDKYHNKARNSYNTGVVNEEVFQTFARKSGILSALTTVEYNSLLKRIKKYNASGQHGGVPPAISANTTFIDIDKFCKRLLLCGDCRQYNLERISERASGENVAVPYSMGEAILLKLQEAAIASSAVGREFLALCRLIDTQNAGKIATSEFIHVAKMMSVVITKADAHALLELLPSSGPYAVDTAVSKRSNVIDYMAINRLIHERLPSTLPPPINSIGVNTAMRYFNENNDLNYAHSLPQLLHDTTSGPLTASTGSTDKLFKGSLPTYANRSNNKTDVGLILSRSVDSGNQVQRNSIDGQRKVHFSVDFDKTIPTASGYSIAAPLIDLSDPLDIRVNVPAYQRMMSTVFRRIKAASDSISRQHAVPFNLVRQCAVFDPSDTGFIPLVAFQNILLSTLQISLTSSDFYALTSMYNRVEDQKVSYKVFYNDFVTATLRSISQITPIGYDNNRIVQRYNQLLIEGKDPKKIFMLYDMDLSGLVSQSDFRKVVSDLQLMRSEHQYIKCVNEYSCINDNAYINYEDFCKHVELISREVS